MEVVDAAGDVAVDDVGDEVVAGDAGAEVDDVVKVVYGDVADEDEDVGCDAADDAVVHVAVAVVNVEAIC